ncbi:MAG: glutamine--fructose-6-phosphate transaminase (isomerizing) [Candidatus Saccharimonadales bacterium]|nr:glutamine--fructose-6-phosphate transaminase (isomerizing) [Candidatus Saccharibacteria bacterium]
MCGIVGYIGSEKKGVAVVLAGLQALEYRGYDSSGVAFANDDGSIAVTKQSGRVQVLADSMGKPAPESATAIGHTRWATHGTPTTINAHPHFNADRSIMVVHNGIIENYAELRESLKKKGYEFLSETDTEVIPHLLDYYTKETTSFEEAFRRALDQLRGAYGLVVMTTHDSERLYAARLGSPLVLGITESSELIIASDPAAIMAHTKQVVYLNDYEYLVANRGGSYTIHDMKQDADVERSVETLDYDADKASLGDYPHFMLKEIFEAPQTIRSATLGRIRPETGVVKLGGLETVEDELQHVDRIVIVACGTASFAGLLGEYALEEIAGIPVEVHVGSEFKYRKEPFSRSTALIVVSQSGETADTIAALKKVENYGVLKLGIVNATGSTIARMTDAGVYCHAGPEQAVASTKAFLAQYTILLLIALFLNNGRTEQYKPLLEELNRLPQKAEQVLEQAENIKSLAQKYAHYKDFMYIGRGYEFPLALEGTLKLKECALIHAEGYAAGELKHGPLALIDKNFPTFAIATNSELLEKTYSNIEEIRARKGPVIAIATQGNEQIGSLADDVIYIPDSLEQTTPLLAAIVVQLFAYYVAVEKGLDVDKPRNLAKSVTVE